MPNVFVDALIGALFVVAPAFAGEVAMNNGQTIWKSTQCAGPAVPSALSGIDSESSATDINTRIAQYNEYTKLVKAYMECLSKEAEGDSGLAANSIISAAQNEIADVRRRADALGAQFKK